MNISNLENFPDCIISPKEQNFCERASVSLADVGTHKW